MSNKTKTKDQSKDDCSCYGEASNYPPIRNVTHPLRYYEFTQDEIRALEDCDKESFYRRCVPFSAVFAAATYAGIKGGRLKPNPRFGALPKVTLAVVVGYFLGKLSYQQACAEKLMALPGSYIGQLLRDRRDGKVTPPPISKQATSMFGAGPSDIYSDAGPGSSLDLDTDRPLFSDDNYRPDSTTGRNDTPGSPAARPPPSLSYDELRRRNRGDHADAKQDPYRIEPGTAPPITRARPPPPPSQPTNKYGDAID